MRPEYPPSEWPTNKQGCPICVVVVWDPNVKTTIDAFLDHKAREARGEAAIPDLRMLLAPTDGDKFQACYTYAKDACVRAWVKGDLIVGTAEHRTQKTAEHRTHDAAVRARDHAVPTYKHACVSDTGFFGIMSAS